MPVPPASRTHRAIPPATPPACVERPLTRGCRARGRTAGERPATERATGRRPDPRGCRARCRLRLPAMRRDERRRSAEPDVLLRADDRSTTDPRTVSSCVRTICGVSSMTMSDWLISSLVCPNSDRRIGACIMPGNPVRILRCSSRSSPASSVDSPSRSRSFVVTLRELNDGTSWPATLMLGPSALLSTDERVEHDLPFVRHARRHLEIDADVLVVERRLRHAGEPAAARGAKHGRQHRDLDRRGSSSASSPPRRAAAASRSTLVCESVSRNFTTAVGTLR